MPIYSIHAIGTTKAKQTARRASIVALSFVLATGFGVAICSAFARQETQKAIGALLPAPIRTVTITADGETRTVDTTSTTVAELFGSQKIVLNKLDRCTVPLTAPITANMEPLVVTRITVETVKDRVILPSRTIKQLTHKLRVGQTKTLRTGKPGEKVTVYRVVTKNGETTRTKVSETVKQPVNKIVQTGMQGASARMLASRGSLVGARTLTMRATGYGPGDNGKWGNLTATGMRPGFGIVAVDPRFIRLGTRLYVENYGYAIAGDTGGAIKGNRIDLGYNSHGEAMAVGRRNVRVMILK
ncbi:MAG: G5 domain-containing protein [Armatimonadetes bacterium]|nr:G5 domain-containing protein [Armatimonadota bacterium]